VSDIESASGVFKGSNARRVSLRAGQIGRSPIIVDPAMAQCDKAGHAAPEARTPVDTAWL